MLLLKKKKNFLTWTKVANNSFFGLKGEKVLAEGGGYLLVHFI